MESCGNRTCISTRFLARAAYHVPTPREFVKPSVPVETVLESELSSELASRLQASGGNLSDRSISVTITQEQLTASLRNLIDQAGYGLQSEGAQISIDEEGIEIFVPIKRGEHRSVVKVVGDIKVDNGAPHIRLDEIHLGGFHVPKMLARTIFTRAVDKALSSLVAKLGTYASLQDISYGNGRMTLTGELIVEVLP